MALLSAWVRRGGSPPLITTASAASFLCVLLLTLPLLAASDGVPLSPSLSGTDAADPLKTHLSWGQLESHLESRILTALRSSFADENDVDDDGQKRGVTLQDQSRESAPLSSAARTAVLSGDDETHFVRASNDHSDPHHPDGARESSSPHSQASEDEGQQQKQQQKNHHVFNLIIGISISLAASCMSSLGVSLQTVALRRQQHGHQHSPAEKPTPSITTPLIHEPLSGVAVASARDEKPPSSSSSPSRRRPDHLHIDDDTSHHSLSLSEASLHVIVDPHHGTFRPPLSTPPQPASIVDDTTASTTTDEDTDQTPLLSHSGGGGGSTTRRRPSRIHTSRLQNSTSSTSSSPSTTTVTATQPKPTTWRSWFFSSSSAQRGRRESVDEEGRVGGVRSRGRARHDTSSPGSAVSLLGRGGGGAGEMTFVRRRGGSVLVAKKGWLDWGKSIVERCEGCLWYIASGRVLSNPVLGFIFYILPQLFGSILSLIFIPPMLLAPLGSAGLIFNILFSRIFLKTPVTRWDFGGTVLIVIGGVLVSLFGGDETKTTPPTAPGNGTTPNPPPLPSPTLEDLIHLFTRPTAIIYFSLLTSLTIILFATATFLAPTSAPQPPATPSTRRRRTRRNPSSPPTSSSEASPLLSRREEEMKESKGDGSLGGMMFAMVGGASASGTLLLGKSGIEVAIITLVQPAATVGEIVFACILLALLIITVVLQLYSLNRSIALTSPLLAIPIFYTLFTVLSLSNSLVGMGEGWHRSRESIWGVCAGVGVIVGGVWVLHFGAGGGNGGGVG
ncbi:hypothetical protein HDU67_008359 [Dinochytrium kinnereticum]|nr:hypothetical protein HDU67_008359 [Dinochytrium kinnereticum]